MKGFNKISRFLILFMAVGATYACPSNNNTIKDNSREAGIRESLRRLDVQYEILIKDDPPQAETQIFRQNISDINQALDQGNYQQAEALVQSSQQWMDTAREKYYRLHLSSVAAGSVKGADLLARAEAFKKKAVESREQGNQWAADQYFTAAIEQGGLAIVAESRSPGQVMSLLDMWPRLQTVFAAAGRPDQAAGAKETMMRSVENSLSLLDRDIQDCIAGKATGCEQGTLSKDEQAFDKKLAELKEKNQLRMAIADKANQIEPGRVRNPDHTPAVFGWSAGWEAFYANLLAGPKNPDDDKKNDNDTRLRAMLAEHNKLKEGALPISGSDISIEETEIYVSGDNVLIKGNITNLKTEPIMNPRVTVTGGVAAEIVDLGYAVFKPLVTTTFQIPLKGFNAEAYNSSLGNIPSHELLVIYRDARGREVKLIRPVR